MLEVASIQFISKPGDPEANMVKAAELIRQAKQAGAKLVVLPELFNVGYDFDHFADLKYNFDEVKSALACLAKEEEVYIAAGILEVVDGEVGDMEAHDCKWYNSLMVFDPFGEVAANYRKLSLFPLSKEEAIFLPGDTLETFTIGEFTFGLMICFDIRFPEIGRRYLEAGCNGLIVASAFPFPRLDHWRTLLNCRAVENQLYVVAANRAGRDGALQFLGNSCIIDPWGTVKATANETEEGFVLHSLDSAKVEEVRKTIPCMEQFQRLVKVPAR